MDGITSTPINKGQLISIDAGFYNSDYYPNPADAGKIASKTYLIQLINNQQSPIELASLVPGGFTSQAPTTVYPELTGYGTNLKYGSVPIAYTNYAKSDVESNQAIFQALPYASTQVYSQFIYGRFKNVGFNRDLYLTDSQIAPFNEAYDYQGQSPAGNIFGLTGGILPYNGSCLIPYDPQNTPALVSGATSASVWLGTFSGITPLGGGVISEFCIATSHPAINAGVTGAYESFVKPSFDNTVVGGIAYPAFRHSLAFFADTNLVGHFSQLPYRTPTLAPGATADISERLDSDYPDRISFFSDDEHLVGKYSCGAYLFLGPPETNFLTVDGFTAQNGKRLFQGSSSAVNIPLVFQFRAADRLNYVGGYRKSGNISNITYVKIMGFDLQQRGQSIFSFDVAVRGQYRNSTLVGPNFGPQITPPAGSNINIIQVIPQG